MVTRRGFTTAIGAIGSVGAAYWTVTNAPNVDLELDVGGVVNDSKEAAEGALSGEPEDPWDQSFNSRLVDRIQFDDNGLMHVTFAPSHGIDSFGIWHVIDEWDESQPIYEHDTGFGVEGMPRYSGTVSVNIEESLRSVSPTFPSNRFKLIGLIRRPLRWERDGQVKFPVPEPLMP